MARKQINKRHTPVHEIEYGSVKASIWANGPDHGSKYHVTLRRLYKDGDGTKEAAGFRTLDLPLVAFIADEAYWWLREREEAEKERNEQPHSAVRRPSPEMVALFRKSARQEQLPPEHRFDTSPR